MNRNHGSSLVQRQAIFSINASFYPLEQISVKFESKYNHLHSSIWIWRYLLQKGDTLSRSQYIKRVATLDHIPFFQDNTMVTVSSYLNDPSYLVIFKMIRRLKSISSATQIACDLKWLIRRTKDTMKWNLKDLNPHETARYGEIASAILNFFVCCMEIG